MFDTNRFADGNGRGAVLTINFVSGAALLLAASWLSFTIFSTRDADLPIRKINSITVEPTILLAGKPFTVHVNVTLNKLCPYEVHWSLARQKDGVEVVKIIEPVKEPPAQTGTQDLPPSVRYVPVTVDPGEYRYTAEVFDRCAGSSAVNSVRENLNISIR